MDNNGGSSCPPRCASARAPAVPSIATWPDTLESLNALYSDWTNRLMGNRSRFARGRSGAVSPCVVCQRVCRTRTELFASPGEYGVQRTKGNPSRDAFSRGARTRSQTGPLHQRSHLRRGTRPQTNSPTYRKWYAAELSAENGRMLYVPERCAHGYQTLERDTEIYYLTSAFYVPSAVRGVRFDDTAFSIEWPLAPTAVSEQDRSWPLVGR